MQIWRRVVMQSIWFHRFCVWLVVSWHHYSHFPNPVRISRLRIRSDWWIPVDISREFTTSSIVFALSCGKFRTFPLHNSDRRFHIKFPIDIWPITDARGRSDRRFNAIQTRESLFACLALFGFFCEEILCTFNNFMK